MKQIILSLVAMCSVYAAQAQSCVNVQQVSTNYAAKQITFDLKWGTCNNTNHLYRVWVFVDYRPVTNVMKGAWGRATIASTDKGTLVSANKGVWVTGTANATQRVTLTLDVIGDKFDWCAFAIDCPPQAIFSNGSYTLNGTPPFTLTTSNGTTVTNSKTFTGCITAITDATHCPGNAQPCCGGAGANVGNNGCCLSGLTLCGGYCRDLAADGAIDAVGAFCWNNKEVRYKHDGVTGGNVNTACGAGWRAATHDETIAFIYPTPAYFWGNCLYADNGCLYCGWDVANAPAFAQRCSASSQQAWGWHGCSNCPERHNILCIR